MDADPPLVLAKASAAVPRSVVPELTVTTVLPLVNATDEVIRALEDTMQDMENTLNEPAPMAGIWEYGDSSIAYTARVWADSEVYWPVYFELRRRVWKTFKDRDIEISYPHMNVHIKEQ